MKVNHSILGTIERARMHPASQPESQPTVLDCYFGPVVCDQADPFWLGATRGTNNTGDGCTMLILIKSILIMIDKISRVNYTTIKF